MQLFLSFNYSKNLVIPVRFERTTLALEGRCSIQLSYGTMRLNIECNLTKDIGNVKELF